MEKLVNRILNVKMSTIFFLFLENYSFILFEFMRFGQTYINDHHAPIFIHVNGFFWVFTIFRECSGMEYIFGMFENFV